MIGREIFLILLVLFLTAVLFAWYRADSGITVQHIEASLPH
jgi:hypothetical protein